MTIEIGVSQHVIDKELDLFPAYKPISPLRLINLPYGIEITPAALVERIMDEDLELFPNYTIKSPLWF